MCATVTVVLNDGRSYRIDKSDYEGFVTRRMGWESVIAKFNGVTSAFTSELARIRIIDAVQNLEKMRVRDFTAILADLTQ
jgi:2-methylcitrate dehydratase